MTGIALQNLTVTHGRHPAVHHLTGRFAPGSLTAIVGPNGAGKTTLLRALAGLHRPESGTITADGAVALLPQGAALDRRFPLTCEEVVSLGQARQAGAFRAIAPDRTLAALAAVGLAGFAARPLHSLSAGQFQRILFARLMVQDAPILLLDEPFNAVDARTEDDLMDVLATWHAEGRTVIVVLHDLELVRARFPQTLLLARHLLAWGPTTEVLRPERLREARLVAEAWAEDAAPCMQHAHPEAA